jgi:hypothetical protein
LQRLYDWPDELVPELTELMSVTMLTARFSGFQRARGVPVRTTVGAPRFWRSDSMGDLVVIAEIAPHGVFRNRKLPELEDQERAYLLRCDDFASDIVHRLAETARAYPGETLCLLCFEDVHAGQVCHRRWFAEWFEKRYGIAIPELT